MNTLAREGNWQHGWRVQGARVAKSVSAAMIRFDDDVYRDRQKRFLFDIQMVSGYFICVSNKDKAELLQGTLDLMVLQTLTILGPLHGYAIASRLEQVSSGAVRLNMGTLYPGLMRLEQRGFIRGRWDVTENNRRARFYAITPAGRRQLAAEKAEWDRTVSIMQAVLREQG